MWPMDEVDDGVVECVHRRRIIIEEMGRLERAGCSGAAMVSYAEKEMRTLTYYQGDIDPEIVLPMFMLVAECGVAECGAATGVESGPIQIEFHTPKRRHIIWMGPHAAWIVAMRKPVTHNIQASIQRRIRMLNNRMRKYWPKAATVDALELLVKEGIAERTDGDGGPRYRLAESGDSGSGDREPAPRESLQD